ncbi:response regulator transcription factor [Sphingomonas sp. CJ20]
MQTSAPSTAPSPSPAPAGTILLVEDDAKLASLMTQQLTALGYAVQGAGDGRAARAAVSTAAFDVILLDRMLPAIDGIDVLKWLRAEQVHTPVILLTALGRLSERVEGLDAGADDYIVKPFEIEEVDARIRAVLRRQVVPAVDSGTLIAGDITVSPLQHRAFRRGTPIDLHKTELNLLAELARNAGSVVTRAMLLERVWGYDFVPTTNIVEAYIRRLRVKLAVPGLPDPIATVRGVGYRLRA